jgi:hypothetical protein
MLKSQKRKTLKKGGQKTLKKGERKKKSPFSSPPQKPNELKTPEEISFLIQTQNYSRIYISIGGKLNDMNDIQTVSYQILPLELRVREERENIVENTLVIIFDDFSNGEFDLTLRCIKRVKQQQYRQYNFVLCDTNGDSTTFEMNLDILLGAAKSVSSQINETIIYYFIKYKNPSHKEKSIEQNTTIITNNITSNYGFTFYKWLGYYDGEKHFPYVIKYDELYKAKMTSLNLQRNKIDLLNLLSRMSHVIRFSIFEIL